MPKSLTSRHIIRSLKAKADAKRKFTERAADWMTSIFGTITFLVLNVAWFTVWIWLNLDQPGGLTAFDPFPFGLLTMIVSLEAIVLSIIVLISQNRAARIGDLREEIDLQVDIINEEETTKVLHMVAQLLEKQGVNISEDQHLQSMLLPTNLEKIERALERQVVNNGK